MVSVLCGRSAEDNGVLLRSVLSVTPPQELVQFVDLVICDAAEGVGEPSFFSVPDLHFDVLHVASNDVDRPPPAGPHDDQDIMSAKQ